MFQKQNQFDSIIFYFAPQKTFKAFAQKSENHCVFQGEIGGAKRNEKAPPIVFLATSAPGNKVEQNFGKPIFPKLNRVVQH